MDKNKNTKPFSTAITEAVIEMIKNTINKEQAENFHEFMHGYTDIFTNNIFTKINYTYRNVTAMIRDKILSCS